MHLAEALASTPEHYHEDQEIVDFWFCRWSHLPIQYITVYPHPGQSHP